MTHPSLPVRWRAAAADRSRRSRKSTQALVAALCAAALVAAAILKPDPRGHGTHEQVGFPPCTFHRLTGLPCPGCGMTTAFAYTVRLGFTDAFMANPFGMLLCLAAALFGAFSLACLATGWRAWSRLGRLESPLVLWSIFGLLLASWGFTILATLKGWSERP